MTTKKQTKEPPVPTTVAPDQIQTITRAEVEAAFTWDFLLTPTRKFLCRSINAQDAFLMGIVPNAVGAALSARGIDTFMEEKALLPNGRAIMRDYICASAISPRVVPEGVEPTEDEISVLIFPDNVLMRWFGQGTSRAMEVDPARVETFRVASTGPLRLVTPHGEGVRPNAEPLDLGSTFADDRAPRRSFSM